MVAFYSCILCGCSVLLSSVVLSSFCKYGRNQEAELGTFHTVKLWLNQQQQSVSQTFLRFGSEEKMFASLLRHKYLFGHRSDEIFRFAFSMTVSNNSLSINS